MSNLIFDPTKRQYELEEDELNDDVAVQALMADQEAARFAGPAVGTPLQDQAYAAGQKEAMTGPGMLPGRGQGLAAIPGVLGESAQTALNLPASVATGLVDMGLMAVDATRYGLEGFGINDGGFKGGWKEIGNNQDNPLTAWRIKNLRPKSGFMKGFNQMGEIVASVISGPGLLKKVASAGIAVGKAGGVGQALKGVTGSGLAQGINKGFDSALDAIGNFGAIGKTGKITQLGAFAPKNRIGLELGKRARSADALAANQLDDLISSSTAGGGPLPNLIAAANQNFQTWKALSAAQKLKVAGSVLAQDAFATFQQTGASPLEDETTGIAKGLSEASWVPSYAQAIARTFVPEEQDAALVQRAKMVAEGSILGFLAQPLIDAGRVAWMARGWGKANQQWKDEVVKILNNGDWSDLATESMLRLPPGEMKLLPPGRSDQPQYDVPHVGQPGGTPHPDGTDFSGPSRSPYGSDPGGVIGELPDLDAWNAGRAPKPAWEGLGATLDDLESSVTSVRTTNQAAQAMNETMDELEVVNNAKLLLDPAAQVAPPAGIRVDTPEPIISLDAIREAVKPELQKFVAQQAPDADTLAAKWGEVQQRAMGLLPLSRKGQVEYLLTQRPRVNAMGVMDAVDAMVVDNLSTRLLRDGAGRVDENFNLTFNKTEAATLDGYDAVADEARQLDELVDSMPAAQQVVDVEAKPVTEQAPGQVTEQAPGQVTEQAPDMPAQVMGEEPAADPRVDRIKDLVRELENPQALPSITRKRKVKELDKLQKEVAPTRTEELGQQLGELQVRSLDSQGEWDGRGLNRYEEPEAALPAIDPLEDTFVAPNSRPDIDAEKFVAYMESKGVDPYDTSPEEVRMLEQDYNRDQLVREQNMLDETGEICDLSP